MTDVFREVDEDLRREQLRKLWDRFGPYIIGLAVLIVLAVSGYKLWEYWQRHQAETSGDRFIAAMNLAEGGKNSDSIAALQTITKDGTGAYPVLATFAIAAQKADSGDRTGAVADFDAIAARGDVSLDIRNLARIRAALLLVDTAPFADISRRMSDLAAVGSPWHASAREVLALAAWHAGDFATAKMYFDQINADQEAPSDMHDRATVMLSLLAPKVLAATTPTAAPAPVAPAPAAAPAAPVAAPAPADAVPPVEKPPA